MSRSVKSEGESCVEIKLTAFAFSNVLDVEQLDAGTTFASFTLKLELKYEPLLYPHDVSDMFAEAGNIVVLQVAVQRHLSIK